MVGEIVGGVGGVVLMAVAGVVGLRLKPLEDKDSVNEKAIETAAKTAGEDLKEAKEALEKRLDALHEDKRELEHRLQELEKTAVTRSMLDSMRTDLERAVDRMGDRVMKHFDTTAERLEKRLEKVEAARA